MLLLIKVALFLLTRKVVKSRQRLLEQEVKAIPTVKLRTPAFLSLWAFVLSSDKNIFVTDAQRWRCQITHHNRRNCRVLKTFGTNLYKAFSVHLKHQKAQKLSLDEAISKPETLDNFIKETFENVMSMFEKPCNP